MVSASNDSRRIYKVIKEAVQSDMQETTINFSRKLMKIVLVKFDML